MKLCRNLVFGRKNRYYFKPRKLIRSCGKPPAVVKLSAGGDVNAYVSIPFCAGKCSFCTIPYVKAVSEKESERYARFLAREIAVGKEFFGLQNQTVRSLAIGGGTPSFLPRAALEHVLRVCMDAFSFSADSEITLEINPSTGTRDKLRLLKDYGVSRISFGVQTFNERILKYCNRIFELKAFLKLYTEAKELGFEHINIDLMCGLPLQTLADIHDTVARAVSLGPSEISCYCLDDLSVSWLTALHTILGKLPNEQMVQSFYRHMTRRLRMAGYQQLGRSCFSKDGYFSYYQKARFEGDPIIGFGIGARGYVHDLCYQNETSFARYYAAVDSGVLPWWGHCVLSGDDLLLVRLFNDLSLMCLDKTWYRKNFSIDLANYFAAELRALKSAGYVYETEAVIQITPEGMEHFNDIQDLLIFSKRPGGQSSTGKARG